MCCFLSFSSSIHPVCLQKINSNITLKLKHHLTGIKNTLILMIIHDCLCIKTKPQTHPELASNDEQSNYNSNSTNQGMLEAGRIVTVRDLLKGLYEKACQQKLWGLVRHTAGMLGKRVEDLAKAVTDLLVRQKQVNSSLYTRKNKGRILMCRFSCHSIHRLLSVCHRPMNSR